METLGIAENLDNARPKQLLWTAMKATHTDEKHIEFEYDGSGMRKLMPGDTIVLKDRTIQNNGYHIAGTVTLMCKQV